MSQPQTANQGYEDDDYYEDENLGSMTPSISPEEAEKLATAKSIEVRSMLSRGNVAEAIAVALANPQTGSDHQSAKHINTQTVMEALLAVRTIDMSNIVKTLDSNQLDTLMKYIYKGLSYPEVFNSSTLLAWHEKTLESAGLGSILRVLSDRRVV